MEIIIVSHQSFMKLLNNLIPIWMNKKQSLAGDYTDASRANLLYFHDNKNNNQLIKAHGNYG